MPSTHSSVIIYYATYVSLASLLLRPESPWSALPQYFGLLIVAPWAVTIAISRIWLGHHTAEQVKYLSIARTIQWLLTKFPNLVRSLLGQLLVSFLAVDGSGGGITVLQS